MTLPVLTLPDFSLAFTVETDASGYGVISKGMPHSLFRPGSIGQGTHEVSLERELMAVVLSVQKWKNYLLGQKFSVLTNQRALKHLLEQREVQPEYQRWLTKLLGYEIEIKYHPGLLNKAADALSRE